MIVLACDHGGLDFKEKVKEYLKEKKLESADVGSYTTERVDIPVYIEKAVLKMREKEGSRGIFICATGTGAAMTANRFRGIRAAVCPNVNYARLAREHNDANVLALGCRDGGFSSFEEVKVVIDAFLDTKRLEGRYLERYAMIDTYL